ncbi:ankyrin repeat domain-containing protein 16 isoform X2 [Temnothorax longispinosus]|uniref:ankyrin repeat domain-containing protein 16 isoform X2 n=1 Tax=Temnothorax longispinosus TaxID=300112 RepID=UPI003A993D13
MLRSQTEVPNVSRDFLRACHSGDVHKVEALVEKHGIIDWSGFRHVASGDTALHVAAREGDTNIVRYLCERFDMPSFKVNVTNKDMKRPLHEAAQFAQEDILKYLLNKDGWTPLLIACRTGDEKAIDILLKHLPTCIDDRSNNGRSALHIAAFHGHERVINLLVASNANLLNARDSSGSSPLHEAVKHGNLDATKCIVSLGADVILLDNVDQTILHVAASTGNAEAVEYILEHNLIDVNCEASFGITPLMLARRNNHSDVVKILIRYGAK